MTSRKSLVTKLKGLGKLRKQNLWTPNPAILLCPNIPKPMHNVAPRIVLGQNWWDRERRAAYASTNYHCQACSVHKYDAAYHKWLEAHELYDIDYQKGTMRYLRAVPLCHFCHNYIHDGRLKALLDRKELHHHKYAAILKHGERVLREAGLERLSHLERERLYAEAEAEGKIAEWSKWRLCIGRRRYKPVHKSYEAWLTHFSAKDEEWKFTSTSTL